MNHNQELITWTNKFSCGIKLIDEQHKGLVDLINEMFNHVQGDMIQEQEYFSLIIHETVKYVKNHFATEERIMIATNFPGYASHKKEHDNFVYTIVENVKDYQTGKRFILINFTRFLKDWALSHIAFVDKLYFEHFRSIATRKPDGRLSITLPAGALRS